MKPSEVQDILNERVAAIPPTPSANGVGSSAPLVTAPNGAPPPERSTGRGANGQFLKGNRCAVGRVSHGRKTAELRAELLACVGPKTLHRIVRKLARLAEDGDLDAAKLLLAYVLGKTAEAADPDKAADREFRQLIDLTREHALLLLRQSVNPEQALEALAAHWGLASAAEARKVLLSTDPTAWDLQIRAALHEIEVAKTPGQSRVEADEALSKELWPQAIRLIGQALDDKVSPAQALEAAEALDEVFRQIERAGGLDPEDRLTHFLAKCLQDYVEKIRPAATTDKQRELLAGLTAMVEGMETPVLEA